MADGASGVISNSISDLVKEAQSSVAGQQILAAQSASNQLSGASDDVTLAKSFAQTTTSNQIAGAIVPINNVQSQAYEAANSTLNTASDDVTQAKVIATTVPLTILDNTKETVATAEQAASGGASSQNNKNTTIIDLTKTIIVQQTDQQLTGIWGGIQSALDHFGELLESLLEIPAKVLFNLIRDFFFTKED